MSAGGTLFGQKGPAFLSTLQHLSPAAPEGVCDRKSSVLPGQRTLSGLELQAAAGQDSGAVPFSGLANKSKSSLVQRVFLVVYKLP